jgi:hypothetical protein
MADAITIPIKTVNRSKDANLLNLPPQINSRKMSTAKRVLSFLLGVFVIMTIIVAVYIAVKSSETSKLESSTMHEVFTQILDRTKILIHTPNGDILRDLRETPYSAGLIEYGRSKYGWYSAFIRLDDAESPDFVDAKADILMGMYYCETNVEAEANGWSPDTPVVIVDGAVFGSYSKDLLVDNKVVYSYIANLGSTGSFWLHYNIATGAVKTVTAK